MADGVPSPVDPDLTERESTPPTTRESILREAISCFASAGYEGTSLNDIAAAVGIRRPSLLHHFPSKDSLYEESFERVLGDWLDRLAGAIAEQASGWAKVESVLRAGFRLFEDNPDYVRLMRREALDGGAHLGIDLSEVLRPLFEAAVEYFEREMTDGTFRRHDPRHLVITAYGSILSYFSDAPFIDGLLEDEALTEGRVAEHRECVIALLRAALLAE